MPPTDDDLRTALLDAAESQLVASPDDEIATRAVCDAVGVSQPVLYRLFGDKRGLLDALADRGLDRYLARKSALQTTGDPVADLLAGYDDHHRFASENPALYRLMFSPRPWSGTRVREQVHAVLVAKLTRAAESGLLRVDPETAAGIVFSADVGLALNRIAQPQVFGGDVMLRAVRDAVFGRILVDPAGPDDGQDRQQADADDRPPTDDGPVAAAARLLRATLPADGGAAFSPEEAALLRRWLERFPA